ncbi:MAG: hypothetical protein AAB260_05515, partial [Planctomycetota bacterium]
VTFNKINRQEYYTRLPSGGYSLDYAVERGVREDHGPIFDPATQSLISDTVTTKGKPTIVRSFNSATGLIISEEIGSLIKNIYDDSGNILRIEATVDGTTRILQEFTYITKDAFGTPTQFTKRYPLFNLIEAYKVNEFGEPELIEQNIEDTSKASVIDSSRKINYLDDTYNTLTGIRFVDKITSKENENIIYIKYEYSQEVYSSKQPKSRIVTDNTHSLVTTEYFDERGNIYARDINNRRQWLDIATGEVTRVTSLLEEDVALETHTPIKDKFGNIIGKSVVIHSSSGDITEEHSRDIIWGDMLISKKFSESLTYIYNYDDSISSFGKPLLKDITAVITKPDGTKQPIIAATGFAYDLQDRLILKQIGQSRFEHYDPVTNELIKVTSDKEGNNVLEEIKFIYDSQGIITGKIATFNKIDRKEYYTRLPSGGYSLDYAVERG